MGNNNTEVKKFVDERTGKEMIEVDPVLEENLQVAR